MKVVNWGLQIILSTLRQAKSIIYKKITSMYPGEGIVVYWKLTDIQLPHGGRYQDKEISNIKKGHRHSKQKSISDYVKVWTARAVGTHASLQSWPVKSCPAHDCITCCPSQGEAVPVPSHLAADTWPQAAHQAQLCHLPAAPGIVCIKMYTSGVFYFSFSCSSLCQCCRKMCKNKGSS